MLKMGSKKRANGFSTTEHRSKHSREDLDYGFSAGLAHLEPQAEKGLRNDNLHNHQRHLPHRDEPHRTDVDDSLNLQLLVATVMGDEQDFETISPENLEELKQEQIMIEARSRAVQQRLMMESKLQGATQSLQRLQDERPLNPLDAERYDRLFAEMSQLQARSKEIQISILKHTVKAFKDFHSTKTVVQGVASDNEHITKGNNSVGSRDSYGLTEFDSRSLYQLPDNLNFIRDLGITMNGGNGFSSKNEFDGAKERLSGINKRLQEIVDDASQGTGYKSARFLSANAADSSVETDLSMSSQLDHLERGLKDISKLQGSVLNDLRTTQTLIETRLDRMAGLVEDTISIQWDGNGYPAPSPDRPVIKSSEAGLDYLEKSIAKISEDKRAMARSLKSIQATSEYEEKMKNTEVVLAGLWDILQSNDDPSGSMGNSMRGVKEKDFSLQTFSTKVQTLFNRVTQQEEQHSVLRRQIEQQRELNAQADKIKDARIAELNTKLTDLEASNSRQSALEADLNSFQTTLETLKEEKANQTKLLASADKAKGEAEASLQKVNSKYEAAEAEREHFESQVVRLQTELTIARAELDASGATRSQQAAQVAAENATQQQLKALMNQCDSLRTEALSTKKERDEAMASAANLDKMRAELKETLADLEELAKAGVEAERERENLEHAVDSLRDKCEELETRLAEEKISGLDVRSPKSGGGAAASNGESTSTVVLKAEFKRLMREARAEGFKTLKAEQDERRRLEAVIRGLRRDQPSRKESAIPISKLK